LAVSATKSMLKNDRGIRARQDAADLPRRL
jgi:hypothetical protein